VVVPKGKASPLLWLLVKLATEQLSLAVGAVQVAIALQELPALMLMFAGHPPITGAVLSVTVTVKEQVAVLPLASVAA